MFQKPTGIWFTAGLRVPDHLETGLNMIFHLFSHYMVAWAQSNLVKICFKSTEL